MGAGSNGLNERKKLILKAIVDAHIANGEPVGSKFLTQNKQIACSSATIRNEMAELEEMGYLEQPHTSAGRVPSEAGYRFYVDQLLDLYHLTEQEIKTLREGLRQKQQELDSIMQTAVTLASRLTNYTALSLKPRQPRVTVQRFEIMRIDDHTAVLIMLIGSIVKTKYIRSSSTISMDATVRLAAALNLKLTGITASEITLPLMMEMERMMGGYDYLVAPVVKSVCEVISLFDGGELRFEGIDRLLAYPDYYDLGRLRELLALFEKKDDLLEVLSEEAQHDDRVQIYIGSENLVKVMDNSTLIFQTIRQNGKPVGAIGIIGPTRMDYRKVIATVTSLTSGVTEVLNRPHGDRNSG
ncbi:MAG: heat-inducible transcription repressor HrcA [Clostridia bacterium]|nr:heat-inducible transcription repressor HrcA [Clostridia bacterium]